MKEEAQGVPQQSFDDFGQPMLSIQTLPILLTSYAKGVKNPRTSQTKEQNLPTLHLQAQLRSKAFAPNCANDGGGILEPSSLFFWLVTPSYANFRKRLLFLTAS